MIQLIFCEPFTAAESPGINLFKACAADDFAKVLTVFKRKRRDDPELIRQHDLFDPAPDEGIAPQHFQFRRQLQMPKIYASIK